MELTEWFVVFTIACGITLILMLTWFLGWQSGIEDARKKWAPHE